MAYPRAEMRDPAWTASFVEPAVVAIAVMAVVASGLASSHARAQAADQSPEAPTEQPAAGTEPLPDPPSPVELRPVTVRFRANVEGVSVRYFPDPILDDDASGLRLRLPPASRYSVLCDAPCDRELPQTHFGLAVTRGAELVRFERPLGVDGNTGVSIDWQDRSFERTGGIVTLAAGIPIGLLLAIVPTVVELSSGDAGMGTGLGLGSGALVLGLAIGLGISFATTGDAVTFEVTPLPDSRAPVFSEEWR